MKPPGTSDAPVTPAEAGSPSAIRIEAGHAPVRGGKLYYEVAGAGHPLVLTHAGVADHRMWDEQFAVFAGHYRVIRYDMRGFGRSPTERVPFSFHQDLFELLVHLGVERAHVLGLSMGGATSIAFTLTHPEMVTALVAVSAGSSNIEAPAEMVERWQKVEEHYHRGDLDAANEIELQMWVDGPRRTPAQVSPAVRERVRVMNLAALSGEGQRVAPDPLDPPAHARLGEIKAPTLIIAGDADAPTVLPAADYLAANIPGARKVIIPDVAHMVNMEAPARFNALVLEFLAKH